MFNAIIRKSKSLTYTDIENAIRDATNSDPHNVPSSKLFEIAMYTHSVHSKIPAFYDDSDTNYYASNTNSNISTPRQHHHVPIGGHHKTIPNQKDYDGMFQLIIRRLTDYDYPRHVLKSLILIQYVLLHGSNQFINDVQRYMRLELKKLQTYRYYKKGMEIAGDIRHRAGIILRLLESYDELQQERLTASKMAKELYGYTALHPQDAAAAAAAAAENAAKEKEKKHAANQNNSNDFGAANVYDPYIDDFDQNDSSTTTAGTGTGTGGGTSGRQRANTTISTTTTTTTPNGNHRNGVDQDWFNEHDDEWMMPGTSNSNATTTTTTTTTNTNGGGGGGPSTMYNAPDPFADYFSNTSTMRPNSSTPSTVGASSRASFSGSTSVVTTTGQGGGVGGGGVVSPNMPMYNNNNHHHMTSTGRQSFSQHTPVMSPPYPNNGRVGSANGSVSSYVSSPDGVHAGAGGGGGASRPNSSSVVSGGGSGGNAYVLQQPTGRARGMTRGHSASVSSPTPPSLSGAGFTNTGSNGSGSNTNTLTRPGTGNSSQLIQPPQQTHLQQQQQQQQQQRGDPFLSSQTSDPFATPQPPTTTTSTQSFAMTSASSTSVDPFASTAATTTSPPPLTHRQSIDHFALLSQQQQPQPYIPANASYTHNISPGLSSRGMSANGSGHNGGMGMAPMPMGGMPGSTYTPSVHSYASSSSTALVVVAPPAGHGGMVVSPYNQQPLEHNPAYISYQQQQHMNLQIQQHQQQQHVMTQSNLDYVDTVEPQKFNTSIHLNTKDTFEPVKHNPQHVPLHVEKKKTSLDELDIGI